MNNLLKLPPKIVRASAGTGKTYQLSSRYLQLILAGEQPDKILATTFTRKAAGEIRDRIFQRLIEAADNQQSAENFAKDLQMPNLTLAIITQTLQQLIHCQHRLLICTLDSFFVSLARAFAAELSLPPKWQLLNQKQTDSFLDQAVGQLCQDSENLLQFLNLLQNARYSRLIHKKLVEQIKNLREIIYASSPDTWKIEHQHQPPSKTILTEAIQQLSEYQAPPTKSGTPNLTYQKSLAKINAIIAGGANWEYKILMEGGDLISKLLEPEPSSYAKTPIPSDLIAITSPIFQHIRHQVFEKINRQSTALRQLMEQLICIYDLQRDQAGAVSFDDIKRLIFKATISGNLNELFFRIDTRISHILLDEFQDTSLSEWVLIEPIADEILSYSDGSHSFFCVGDTKQAIYGFRGGLAEIFDQLENRWPQLITERLEVSRRSSQVILNFVNIIFQNLTQNLTLANFPEAASSWQSRFDQHTAYNQQLAGQVSFVHCQEEQAINLMAEQVKKLSTLNPNLTIGILVRYQKQVAECLFALSQRGIAASGEGGSALTDSPVVAVLLSFLWFVDHPQDAVAHFHVASSPAGNILKLQASDPLDHKDQIAKSFREQVLVNGLRKVINDLANKLFPIASKRDRSRLRQLVNATASYETPQDSSLSDFVEYIKKLKIADPELSNIQVMTIHKSKGLEFDAVILCDLDYELVRASRSPIVSLKKSAFTSPTNVLVRTNKKIRAIDSYLEEPYAQQQSAELLESLSVLYVSLTRAKQALYLYANCQTNRKTAGHFMAQAVGNLKLKKDDADTLTPITILEIGDDTWLSNRHLRSLNPAQEPRILNAKISFAAEQLYGLRNIPRVRPSKQKGGIKFHGHTKQGKLARNKGILLHRLFENLVWSEDPYQVHASMIKELAKWAQQTQDILPQEVTAACELFENILKNPKIFQVLSKARYAEWSVPSITVERERRFSVITQEGLSVGTIDRLVLGGEPDSIQFAEIIDFKSDQIPSKHFEEHSKQLASYREAVSAMYKLDPVKISCQIIYLETFEIFAI